MPRFGWSGAVEGRPGAVARPAGTRSTAPRRPVVRRRRAARSRRCFERGGPPSIFGRRHLAHGEGQLQGSLRLLFSAFAGCASRWMVARPRLSSAVEAVRATPRPSQGLSGTGAAHVPLNGLIWPRTAVPRSPLPQRRPGGFLPLGWPPHGAGAAGTPTRPFLARQESRPATILRCAAGLRLRRRSPPAS